MKTERTGMNKMNEDTKDVNLFLIMLIFALIINGFSLTSSACSPQIIIDPVIRTDRYLYFLSEPITITTDFINEHNCSGDIYYIIDNEHNNIYLCLLQYMNRVVIPC